MPCTEHQKNVWEHRKGFYKQFFHWYGWASTTKPITFFRQTLQSLEKKQSPKRGSEKPLRGKSRIFSKKKVFFMNQS